MNVYTHISRIVCDNLKIDRRRSENTVTDDFVQVPGKIFGGINPVVTVAVLHGIKKH